MSVCMYACIYFCTRIYTYLYLDAICFRSTCTSSVSNWSMWRESKLRLRNQHPAAGPWDSHGFQGPFWLRPSSLRIFFCCAATMRSSATSAMVVSRFRSGRPGMVAAENGLLMLFANFVAPFCVLLGHSVRLWSLGFLYSTYTRTIVSYAVHEFDMGQGQFAALASSKPMELSTGLDE